jgi:hypothetical protein
MKGVPRPERPDTQEAVGGRDPAPVGSDSERRAPRWTSNRVAPLEDCVGDIIEIELLRPCWMRNDYALAACIHHGLWGGLSAQERAALLASARATGNCGRRPAVLLAR